MITHTIITVERVELEQLYSRRTNWNHKSIKEKIPWLDWHHRQKDWLWITRIPFTLTKINVIIITYLFLAGCCSNCFIMAAIKSMKSPIIIEQPLVSFVPEVPSQAQSVSARKWLPPQATLTFSMLQDIEHVGVAWGRGYWETHKIYRTHTTSLRRGYLVHWGS